MALRRFTSNGTTTAKQGGPLVRRIGFVLLVVFIAGANLAFVCPLVRNTQLTVALQAMEDQHSASSSIFIQSSNATSSMSSDSINRPTAYPRVFVGVLSSGANFKSREVIRQTWGADPLLGRVMFFCLRPANQHAFKQLRSEAAVTRDIHITSEVSEHYFNITYSVLDIFKVAASMANSFDYVIKTDDDIYVRPQLLLDALQSMPRQWLYAGWPMEADIVHREGGHAVPYQNWPHDAPVRYAYGAGYALSMDLAVEIAAGAPHMIMQPNNLLIIEDIAVGYWVQYISYARQVQITYNANITRAARCTPDTMFYHVTRVQPKWAEIMCMHMQGGQCCKDKMCRGCIEDLRMEDMLGHTTDFPMLPQPPFAPGCFPSIYQMHQVGCAVMDCSLDPSCTTTNTSCCAYINFELLSFLDRFLTAHCLQHQYMLLYGTVLGSVRNETILPHTEDIDVGLTPLAIQFLERNSTKELLWRHGYTFWYHYTRGVWKICPHAAHPSPHFQAVMVTNQDVQGYKKSTGRLMSGYADAWLMWPVAAATRRCSAPARDGEASMASLLRTPWDEGKPAVASRHSDVCGMMKSDSPNTQTSSRSGSALLSDSLRAAAETFCVSESDMPHIAQGSRAGRIEEKMFPIPDNYERVMAATYGEKWRMPTKGYHGKSVYPKDEERVKAALLEKLSVTGWGDTPWEERKRACKLVRPS